MPPIKATFAVCCAAIAVAAGQARGEPAVQQAIEARERGAIFESDDILRRTGPAPSPEVRVEQAVNAYYLGRFEQARGILGELLADPASSEALKRRAVAWVLRINRRQLNRIARKPLSVSSAFGMGADSNANNALDSREPDGFDLLPDVAAPEQRGDGYVFYRVAARHALRPAQPVNLGGYPLVYQWTNSLARQERRFNNATEWSRRYTQLASELRAEKHRQWAGRTRLSLLDYRLGSDRLLFFGSAEASFKRLTPRANVGVQATLQRLDYRRDAWLGRTGNRLRVQLFVEGAVTLRHSYRAGIEPQWVRAGDEFLGYRGVRAHLQHVWRGQGWRLHTRLIYEKNRYRNGETDPGEQRRHSRLRFTANLVRPLTERLDLSLAAQYIESNSSPQTVWSLSRKRLELSVRHRF